MAEIKEIKEYDNGGAEAIKGFNFQKANFILLAYSFMSEGFVITECPSAGRTQATEEFKEVYDLWKAGEMTAVKAMAVLGVKKTTFYKLV